MTFISNKNNLKHIFYEFLLSLLDYYLSKYLY